MNSLKAIFLICLFMVMAVSITVQAGDLVGKSILCRPYERMALRMPSEHYFRLSDNIDVGREFRRDEP